jgi:hypothetical protein
MRLKSLFGRYPYLLPFATGLLLFVLSLFLKGRPADLLVNLSASLVVIPLVIVLYERVRERAEAERNRDLSNYVKMQADRELLTLLGRIAPLVIGTPTPGLNKVLKVLNLSPERMQKNIETQAVMVFYLATDWAMSEAAIRELVSSELTYNNLSVDERNNFIRLIGAIRRLAIATESRYFMADGQPDPKYNVVNGTDLNSANKFENRYLLMAKTKKSDQFAVAAFNDIDVGRYRADYTQPMKANNEGKGLLLDAVAEVLDCVAIWHKQRGDVFLLDTQHFRAIRAPKRPSAP